ncbi:hypothetical protein AB4Y30_13320 [Ornithinibacillus sp. 4-3]|uniref:DUF7878 domain-containing protein n=1 Tax=Ornithinibacillus sp. 4-3 TaxID=3231488 RepID=A0AB39HMS8_9BACI
MDTTSCKVTFYYKFTSDKDVISNRQRKDVPAILDVTTNFKIYINSDLYFDQEEFPILEFYKHLYKWINKNGKNNKIQEFHYFSIEYDDYDDGALISLLPFGGNKARLKSIWAEQELYNIFVLNDIVKEFIVLEQRLKVDIENYYGIKLAKFIKHIP